MLLNHLNHVAYLLVLLLNIRSITSFQKLFDFLKPIGSVATPTLTQVKRKFIQEKENILIGLCRSKETDASLIVSAFEELENLNPSKENLLEDAECVRMIDGRWNLLYTISNYVGKNATELRQSGVTGVVNASGVQVDATEDLLPVQSIDITTSRISNEVFTKIPLLGCCLVKVGGPFKPVVDIGRRAEVEFDSLEIFKKESGKAVKLFSAGWIFTLLKKVKPENLNGGDKTSWLETTYLTERIRLGRGNKGSIFVLEREGEIPQNE